MYDKIAEGSLLGDLPKKPTSTASKTPKGWSKKFSTYPWNQKPQAPDTNSLP